MTKKINIKPITITLIVVGFLFFLKTQFPHYQVSSGSMSPQLSPGDIVLANQFQRADFQRNDIVVFNMSEEVHLSRVVGLPGDQLEIIDGVLFVNGLEQTEVNTSFTYKVLLGDHPPLAEFDIMLLLKPENQFEEYTAELTLEQLQEMKSYDFVLSAKKKIHPKGYRYTFSQDPIFPNRSSFNWSRDNFGPITIPKKGSKLGGSTFIVKNNYYFVLGDNRHQSVDSRFFGMIPESNIQGELVTTLYSTNE